MADVLPYGCSPCEACGFPVRHGRGRCYCNGNCRIRALRVRRGELTKARAEELARHERENAARRKAGLPPKAKQLLPRD